MADSTHRPWFGPKRIGYGVRPQTWQGWLIMAVIAIAIIVTAYLFAAH